MKVGGFKKYQEVEHLFRNGSQQGWRYGFSAQKGQTIQIARAIGAIGPGDPITNWSKACRAVHFRNVCEKPRYTRMIGPSGLRISFGNCPRADGPGYWNEWRIGAGRAPKAHVVEPQFLECRKHDSKMPTNSKSAY